MITVKKSLLIGLVGFIGVSIGFAFVIRGIGLSFSDVPAMVAVLILALPYLIFIPIVFICWPFQRLRERYRRRIAEEFLDSSDGACLRDKFFREGYQTRIKEEEEPLTKSASNMSTDEYLDTWLKKTALSNDKNGENPV